MSTGKVKVGIVGSRGMGDVHARSFQIFPEEAEVIAIASPTSGNAANLAKKFGIPNVYTDYHEMLKNPDIEMITIAAPNYLHCQITVDAARAGKHVVCEKPFSMSLDESDIMIEVCKKQGVLQMYAEMLYFAPKYVKVKELADQGAFGNVYLVKQSEKHFGPGTEWFWDVNQSGGGVFMDMGCHGMAFVWWFLGKPKLKSITTQMGTYVHSGLTKGEDNSIAILEFEGNKIAFVENSWASAGGSEDRVEVFGDKGSAYSTLHTDDSLRAYSGVGYGPDVDKDPNTRGWTYPIVDELYNYGFPQEMAHFSRCVRGKEMPICTGEDGRFVQEALFAGYQSAGSGKKVEIPFTQAYKAQKPIDFLFSPLSL